MTNRCWCRIISYFVCSFSNKKKKKKKKNKKKKKKKRDQRWMKHTIVPPDHLLLDRSSNIGPLISCWELHKFKNSWNKSFRTSKILTLLYQQFSNLLISQRDMSGPRLGALSNNRWSGAYELANDNLLYICCIYTFCVLGFASINYSGAFLVI